MVALEHHDDMDVEAFLAFVEAYPHEKWELIDGVPYAMAGGTVRHAVIGANIAEALGPKARVLGCRALRDLFFRIPGDRPNVFDPDVMIRCGPPRSDLDRTIEDAVAVFEVLSPSILSRDRGIKLEGYMRAPSLTQIVLVYPGEWRVETWARDGVGAWAAEPQVLRNSADRLMVPCVEADVTLAEIYADAVPAP